MINLRNNSAAIVSFALPVIIAVFLFGGQSTMGKRPDSGSYLNLADMIISGEIFEKKEISEVRWGRAVRTPGYSLFIVAAKVGLGNEQRGLYLIHLALGLFAIVFLSAKLRVFSPPIITGTIVVLVQFAMRKYFPTIMSEWIAFNLLLILFGLVVDGFRSPSTKILFAIGLLASFCVLIRPSLLPVMLLMPVLVVYRWRVTIAESSLLAITLLPLVLWMSFNFYHLGVFKLAENSGQTAFGVGSMVGHANIEPGDSEALKNFITVINEKKTPPKGAEDEFIANLDVNYSMFRLTSNLFWVAWILKPEDQGPIAFDREILKPYGRRALESSPGNYVRYVLHGLKITLNFGAPLLTVCLLVVPLFSLYRKKNHVLSWVALLMFAIHMGQAFICAAVLVVFDRYLIVTFYPYLASIMICLTGLLIAEGVLERIAGKLPSGIRGAVEPMFRVTR